MNLFTPCLRLPKGMMEQSEAEILDVLIHLLAPDVVVEVGRAYGHSARLFARHARVVSLDLGPKLPKLDIPEDEDLIAQIQGCSPQDLDLILPYLKGVKRWVFFHDSDHIADVLVPEVEWAFKHRAACVIYHDAGLVGPEAAEKGSMPEGAERLKKLGRRVLRVCDQGRPTSADLLSTGFGLIWPC